MKLIYIYGILDDDDNIIYVGESTKPQIRLRAHHTDSGYERCKILEIYENREHYWIDKLISEGNTLNNKERLSESETWCVGDVVLRTSFRISAQKLRNKLTGEEYRSGGHASREIEGVPRTVVDAMRRSSKGKYHDILEFID